MARYSRRVVRFIWDFCKKPVLATKLSPTQVWFKNYYPEVGRVVVELIGKKGNIYIGFNWSRDIHCVSYGTIVELLWNAGVFLPTNTSSGLFKGVMSSRRSCIRYNEVQVMISPVNGEHFTLTAMKRCKTLFELLGMDVEEDDHPPLVGNFRQESNSPTGYYMDFGTQLYLEVFKDMPPASKLFKQQADQAT